MNNVRNIGDHIALLCGECGSAKFALLRSDGIECHGCGKRHPFKWRELDATQCEECAGAGRIAANHKVDDSGFTLPGWDECEACESLGWVGPEAKKRAALEAA
jgi:hypothetical protein